MKQDAAANHLPPFGTILGPTWPQRSQLYNFLDPEQSKTPWVYQNRSSFAVKIFFMCKPCTD